ncbi:MAG TPA: TerC family protein [Gammaproteobacteria bacterium]|nr:TerC family protein [Gammaproteobacteria bacterium]
MHSVSEWWMWCGFIALVIAMLAVDIILLGGKKAHRVSTREALSWVIVWVTIALMFNLLLWWYLAQTGDVQIAHDTAMQFLTGYLIEESLSVDNMFVFVMIFSYFAVPYEYQRRVLLYGVLGAIFMRLVMILAGLFLLTKFHWILYIFGVFLLITGFKMLLFAENKKDLAENPLLTWMNKHLRITRTYHGHKFIIRQNKLIYFTPLFLVLVLIEFSDLIFAMDSIPAIFAITEDPFIVFTSNIFAILGLRALYFLVANMMEKFHLLKYGLAIILIFIGIKMLVAHWMPVPIGWALVFIAITLVCSAGLSLVARKK